MQKELKQFAFRISFETVPLIKRNIFFTTE